MGNSGPAREVGTFSNRADDLLIGEILSIEHSRDSPATWSISIHSVGLGPDVYGALLEEFSKGYRHTTMSTAFHPQTDGQSERTIQVLEDMLGACVLDHKGSWEEHLPLVEFAYNNSYHVSIQMAPYKALYRRPCRSLLCWTEVGDSSITGPDLIRDTSEKVGLIRQRLLTAQSRQKSYADVRRRPLEFEVGDHVFLKVMPKK